MAKVKLQADIKEVIRYTYEIDVDDNKSKEEQVLEAIEKFKAFREDNCSCSCQVEPIDDVLCTDSSFVEEYEVEAIYSDIK